MSAPTANEPPLLHYAPMRFFRWNQLGIEGVDLPETISGALGFIPIFPTKEAIKEVYPDLNLETQVMKIPVGRPVRKPLNLDELKEGQAPT